jgi:hypothetical protein
MVERDVLVKKETEAHEVWLQANGKLASYDTKHRRELLVERKAEAEERLVEYDKEHERDSVEV